jgi:CHAT domain-containing protein/tetratricopeptide (TPR) repeat protein
VTAAAAALLLALAAAAGAAGPDAARLAAEARERIALGRYAAAESTARALLALPRGAAAADSLAEADALDLLVESLWRQGHAGRAETGALAERAVGLRERLHPSDDPRRAQGLLNLGDVRLQRGQRDDAGPLFARALALRERAPGPDSLDYAWALNEWAAWLQAAGRPQEALRARAQVLELRRRHLGDGHPLVAWSVSNLAYQHQAMGDFRRAEELFRRCLGMRERGLGPDHPDVASGLKNLANLLLGMGRYDEAGTLFERALAVRERAFGPDHAEVANSLNDLASLRRALGDYAAARAGVERALAIRERVFGPDHSEVATSLVNLAALLAEMGDDAHARRLYERAVAIRERVFGPAHPGTGIALEELARVAERQGRRAEAEDLVRRALEAKERGLGPDHPSVARTLDILAGLLTGTGRHDEARAAARRALAIREAALGPGTPETAASLQRLGALEAAGGRAAAACSLLARAAAIREAALGAAHPALAATLAALGAAQARLPDDDAALGSALRAERIAREHLERTITVLPEAEALAYGAARVSGLDLALRLAAARPGDSTRAGRAWDALLRSRALVLGEMAARRAPAAGGRDSAALAEHEEARRRLAGLLGLASAERRPERYAALVEEAHDRYQASERRLAGQSADYRARRREERAGLDEVRRALPPGGALVAYAVAGGGTGGEPPCYVAFVAGPGGAAPAVVPLGRVAAVDSLVRAWRATVTAGADDPAAAEARCRRAGQRLRAAVWDPLRPALADATLALVVPAGLVHLVNLAALPGTGTRYLVEEGPLLHLLTAERDLLATHGSAGRGLLALGGVDFDRQAVSGPRRAPAVGRRFAPLPGTAREVAEIRALWERSAAGGALCLTGARATEGALDSLAADRRVVHLATHGFFGRRPADDARAGQDGSAAALLASAGLALAGANGRPRGERGEDGLLTVPEISALDLSGADWVVLSACETGVGAISAPEGVLGLRRAFLVAGAHTVVTSLWKVDDAATRLWMQELYRARLERGRSSAEAVRAASRELLRRRRELGLDTHPAGWGSFVAVGDWR